MTTLYKYCIRFMAFFILETLLEDKIWCKRCKFGKRAPAQKNGAGVVVGAFFVALWQAQSSTLTENVKYTNKNGKL